MRDKTRNRTRTRMLPGQPMFRKRRQRKSHRTGEFTELGFDVFGYLQSDFGGFLDMLIPFVEARGLIVGGLVNERTGEVDLTVMRPDRGSATEEDVGAMAGFLAGQQQSRPLLVSHAYDVNWSRSVR